jgi:hypothetical protein
MLKFSLFDNALTPDPNDCMGLVVESEKVTIEQLVAMIVVQGSILKKTECNAVIYEFFEKLAQCLAEGKGFTSEYLIIDHSISGVFTNEDDVFDPARHQVNVNTRMGSELKGIIKDIKLQKVKTTTPMPVVGQVRDMVTDTYNSDITPKGSLHIYGENLKIGNPESAEQGVYFIDSKNVEYKAGLRINKPKTLEVVIPETLKKGEYTLEVRTVIRNNATLKKGRLNETLVVS